MGTFARISGMILFNRWFLGFCFVIGGLLAGSDGAWFPWVNIIGLAALLWVAVAANMVVKDDQEHCTHKQTGVDHVVDYPRDLVRGAFRPDYRRDSAIQ